MTPYMKGWRIAQGTDLQVAARPLLSSCSLGRTTLVLLRPSKGCKHFQRCQCTFYVPNDRRCRKRCQDHACKNVDVEATQHPALCSRLCLHHVPRTFFKVHTVLGFQKYVCCFLVSKRFSFFFFFLKKERQIEVHNLRPSYVQ